MMEKLVLMQKQMIAGQNTQQPVTPFRPPTPFHSLKTPRKPPFFTFGTPYKKRN